MKREDEIMNSTMKNIQQFYKRLQDDESKRIFLYRWMYSLTEDKKWIREIGKETPEGKSFYRLSPGENDYIFGCGEHGKKIYDYFKTEWKGFIDNNSQLWGGEAIRARYIKS